MLWECAPDVVGVFFIILKARHFVPLPFSLKKGMVWKYVGEWYGNMLAGKEAILALQVE